MLIKLFKLVGPEIKLLFQILPENCLILQILLNETGVILRLSSELEKALT